MVSFISSFEKKGIDFLSLPNMTLDASLPAPWALLIIYILSCL